MRKTSSKLKFIPITILTILFSLGVSISTTQADEDPFQGGDGSVDDPYEISTCQQLQSINNTEYLDKNFVLINDIYCGEKDKDNNDNGLNNTKDWDSGKGFIPIGGESTYFTGDFNGRDYQIFDLYINRPDEDCIGLFGYTVGSSISNIGLENVDITGRSHVGGLVGINENGTISNSYSTGDVSGGGTFVGGLAGVSIGNITASYSKGNVSGADNYIGGFVGMSENGTISNSYSTGDVSIEDVSMESFDISVGGFVGGSRDGTISNSYSTGDVLIRGLLSDSTECYIGGFVGEGFTEEISNSYSTGDVLVENTSQDYIGLYIGGFVGYSYTEEISNSYSTGDVLVRNVLGESYPEMWIGGFVGYSYTEEISNSYSTGDVSIEDVSGEQPYLILGGFVGYSYTEEISNSYSIGGVLVRDISADGGSISMDAGGFTGLNGGTISNSAWLQNETVNTNINAIGNEQGETDLTIVSTEDELYGDSHPIYGSWDFDTEWFTTDRYPILQFSAKMIEAESGNNGTITPSGTVYVAAGADKTFVITPDSGFRVSKMSIDGKSTKVTQTYKFNRVSQNHQISVSFTKVSNLSGSFTLPTPETPKDDSPQTPDTPQPPDTPQLGSYPTQPIRLGADNDPDQVKLLQEFLNLFENAGLEVTGIFTKEDEAALIRWQEKYASDVLSPWGLTQGTGFLYTTSLSKMRELFLERYPEAQPTYIFSRDLRMSMTGDDVKLLQQFLNSQGFTLTQQGAGSPGNETTFFGRLTYNALIRFQEAYSDDILRPIGLTSGTGIFSQYSRKKAEELSGRQGFGG